MAAIEIKRVNATAVLTMNRPDQRNALDFAMREDFAAAVAEVRDDESVRAIVLTGAGGHFCAGGDIKAMGEQQGKKRDIFEGRERIRKIHRWFDELVDLEKPVIAAVDGVAFGAGLSLALCADFVLASPRAKFCSVFARLGYIPDTGAMYLLPRAIGLSRAKDMVFTGRVVGVQEAKEIGLVQTICEQDLLQSALDFAERFHNAPTGALGIAKSVMNRAFESDRKTVYAQESMAQAMCRESDFHEEAVRRFLAKEAPLYQWPDAKP
ncbi:enoyl-CoA hydratase/isomerase family protein [Polaromonas sp. SM01]|uniref:enoyl-CoA hydratase/isomerase family protein n=1 Tax=Polaromonas sp. SM01 TaxID=3085630 RepID=UPI0029815EDD|nr:enoyl-CoA hydratase/isomerase family protein [Polaromonas sp. SM01]MDW5444158.1 enoyl-CoA hydratase/isomerase family protein [Polaromonas sp. SM01]